MKLTFLWRSDNEPVFAKANKTEIRRALGHLFDVDLVVDQALATGAASVADGIAVYAGHPVFARANGASRTSRQPRITLVWSTFEGDVWGLRYDIVTRSGFASKYQGSPAEFAAIEAGNQDHFVSASGWPAAALPGALSELEGAAEVRIAWMLECGEVTAEVSAPQDEYDSDDEEVDEEDDEDYGLAWPDDPRPFGPATAEVQELVDRAARLTKAEGNALWWAQSETRIGQMFAEPWHDSAIRKGQVRVTAKVVAISIEAHPRVLGWTLDARQAAQAAVARSAARDTAASAYVGDLAQALVVADRLSPSDVGDLFHVWRVVVVEGKVSAFKNPENEAYRRAGSCVAPCFSIVTLLVAMGIAAAVVIAKEIRSRR
jgi:hypothetical protein